MPIIVSRCDSLLGGIRAMKLTRLYTSWEQAGAVGPPCMLAMVISANACGYYEYDL